MAGAGSRVPTAARVVLVVVSLVVLPIACVVGRCSWDSFSNNRRLADLKADLCDVPPPSMDVVSCSGRVQSPDSSNACVFGVELVLTGPRSPEDVRLHYRSVEALLSVEALANRTDRLVVSAEIQDEANWDGRCN